MDTSDVTVRSGSVQLGGTLHRPADWDSRVIVLLIAGSGPTGRTNGGYFDPIIAALLAEGIGVFSYDKRGVGQSTGRWSLATVDDLAADAVAAAGTVRRMTGVERLGLFGHSEGGWVGLRAASAARADFLVLNSCPTVSFYESEIHALTTAGVGPPAARAFFDTLRAAARDGAGVEESRRLIGAQADAALSAVLDESGFRLDLDTWAQLRSWIDYDPEPDLLMLRVPTIALYGDADPLTSVLATLRVIEDCAPAVEAISWAGADHRIQIDGRLAPRYLTVVTEWIKNRCGPPSIRAGSTEVQEL